MSYLSDWAKTHKLDHISFDEDVGKQASSYFANRRVEWYRLWGGLIWR